MGKRRTRISRVRTQWQWTEPHMYLGQSVNNKYLLDWNVNYRVIPQVPEPT